MYTNRSSIPLLPYVISSRVRLARNVCNYRFPHVALRHERQAVLEKIQDAVGRSPCFYETGMFRLDLLSPLDRRVLEEEHLISHSSTSGESHRLVIIRKGADASILVNEEDHLRIQAFCPGLDIRKAWKIAQHLEFCLREKLDFAYSEQYGYLTTCPSNAGLGMRVSAMMFVPGLMILKKMAPLVQECVSAGYTVRGAYGEGSKSQGYLLQISRQNPSVRKATTLLKELENICDRIIEQEKRARFRLFSGLGKTVQHHVAQAEKQLFTRQQMNLEMGINLLAMHRLRISLGISAQKFSDPYTNGQQQNRELKRIDHLFMQIQPAHVLKYGIRQDLLPPSDQLVIEQEREAIIRAKLIRVGFAH